uniref:Myomesin 2 n=1 Tax=Junco hyemalis TaxID=40217 RepID=A0A8C5JE35_JUNHY
MSSVAVPFYQRRHKHFDQSYRNIQTRYVLEEYAVEENMALERHIIEERISRAPEILVRLRSHTIWEKMSVSLCFTVQGFPTPVVQWYKNEELISPASDPTKYRIESKYGVHVLHINRCSCFPSRISRSAYSITENSISCSDQTLICAKCNVLVLKNPFIFSCIVPLSHDVCFTHIDVQFLEKFGVTFATEGETLTLKCSMLITPELKRLRPRAEWYRDDVLLKDSKWTQLYFGEGQAALSFSHLNKDDEGLYTLRMVSRGGISECSAFLFVRDADALIAGAPGAPMDVKCHDANRDYVIVTWKPPNTTSESPVIGYFVDKCEVGLENWVQCNDAPVKVCKYPVTGLQEGRSYVFRVRAVNSAGISRPSRASEPVAALDPLDLERTQSSGFPSAWLICCLTLAAFINLTGDVQIPSPPTNVHASEISKTYVVLSWDPPVPRGREPLTYFIEKSMVGSGSWQRVNAQVAVKSPRYAVFDLAEGKPYVFRVLSANKNGISDPSEITEPIQPQDTIVLPSAPGQVVATRNTKTSVVVQWDKPKHEEDLYGYYIEYSVVGSNRWEPSNHKPIKYNRFVVHGLETGEQYVFRVKAVNALGLSENSQESEAVTVQAALTCPSYPHGITLLNCDGHSMTLGWKAPRYSGGSPILGYYIDKREANHQNWHEVNSSLITRTIYTVKDLTEDAFYEFKVAAANLVGIGQPSDPSEHFKCKAWTMPEPGPAYDLMICEVRNTSLVLLWKAPVYEGKSPITGYLVDYKEVDTEDWITANEKPTSKRYFKVTDLHEGHTYVFKVRAVNDAGVGKSSEISEPVLVEERPGTKEIYSGVDEEGNIYLAFDCKEATDASHFAWGKSYEEIDDSHKFKIETEGNHSKLYFKNPDKSDLGTYSISVSDTDGISSSFVMDDQEFERLMALSYEIKNPTIPLKSELAYEVLDKGEVRFWIQAESLSPDSTFRFVINDKEVENSDRHKINCDRSNGIIEMVMEKFTIDNEGTYTVQIQDGKAKNQSSLVLIGDVLAESELQRKEYLRKQGPHFSEFLYWNVTEECEVLLSCKVANIKKETDFKWYKDGSGVDVEELPDLQKGECHLSIPKVLYRLPVTNDSFCKSASPLKILCTEEGIRLQCFLKYYNEEMKVSWSHRESKISSGEKMKIGGGEDVAWLQISEPTEKDKGNYTFEIFGGKESFKRTLDLSGQGIFIRPDLLCLFIDYADFIGNRRITVKTDIIGGLPDVVTIMDGKTLNLTCTVFGNPDPEVVWFKNDKAFEIDEHYAYSLEQGKYASLTIKGVTSEDSGKYSIHVKNKYGGETVDVTVSVYRHGEKMPEIKPGQLAKPRPIPPSEEVLKPEGK